MKVGEIYIVNTDQSHITSHKGDIVVVKSMRCPHPFLPHAVRAFNLNRQTEHDYFVEELNEVKNEKG